MSNSMVSSRLIDKTNATRVHRRRISLCFVLSWHFLINRWVCMRKNIRDLGLYLHGWRANLEFLHKVRVVDDCGVHLGQYIVPCTVASREFECRRRYVAGALFTFGGVASIRRFTTSVRSRCPLHRSGQARHYSFLFFQAFYLLLLAATAIISATAMRHAMARCGNVHPRTLLPFVVEHPGGINKEGMQFFRMCRDAADSKLNARASGLYMS